MLYGEPKLAIQSGLQNLFSVVVFFFFGPGDLVKNSFKRRIPNLTLPGSSS